MSRIRRIDIALVLACTAFAGCSSLAERTQVSPEAGRIAVYEATGPKAAQYSIVKRLWIESWRSAFTVPGYASEDAAKADLQERAVALGGDAVMNFGCYRSYAAIASGSQQPLFCNGTVVKHAR